MFPGLDLYYADPAPLTTPGEELDDLDDDLDDLDGDLDGDLSDVCKIIKG